MNKKERRRNQRLALRGRTRASGTGGAFGNKQSKKCVHNFGTENWKYTNCLKCGAKDHTMKKFKFKSKLKKIFNMNPRIRKRKQGVKYES